MRMPLQYLVFPSVHKCSEHQAALSSRSAGPCHLPPGDLAELVTHPGFSSYSQEVSYSLTLQIWLPRTNRIKLFPPASHPLSKWARLNPA